MYVLIRTVLIRLRYILCLCTSNNSTRNKNGSKNYKTSGFLRKDPYHLAVTWRTLQYLVKVPNLEGAFILLYAQVAIVGIFLVAAVSLVFEWDNASVVVRLLLGFMAGFSVLFWCIILTLGGLQYKWSEETINSWRIECWKRKQVWKYMERFKLAVRPFSLGDGKRYYIQPLTVLKFLKSVSRNAFRALITYADVMGYT